MVRSAAAGGNRVLTKNISSHVLLLFEPHGPGGLNSRVSPIVSRSSVRMQPRVDARAEPREKIGSKTCA